MSILFELLVASSAAFQPTSAVVPAPPQGGSGPPRALLSNVPGAATNVVPGLGVPFQPGTAENHFDRVYAHPSGHWAITALADLSTSSDECLIVDGALAIQEGAPAPWTASETCGTIDTRVAVNAAGDFVLATNVSGTTNDDFVAGRVGGTWTVFAQEGAPVPGLPGATLDDAIDSPVLLDDGRVGYAADGIDGVASTDVDDVLVLGVGLLVQEGITVPPGQAGGGTRSMENFDLSDFWTSSDGAHWLVQGDLEGSSSTDDVVLVDGTVVLQEGEPVPGAGFVDPIDGAGIHGVSMAADGTWFARGDNDGVGLDWVVRDGVVIASTGAPLFAGATETWDDTRTPNGFFCHAGNGLGNWIVGGATDASDEGRDTVLVLDGTQVVARESDPVDLDGNGHLDDGVFIASFGEDDVALTDDLAVLAVVQLADTTGSVIGQALIEIPAGSYLGTNFCDATSNSTGRPGVLRAHGSDSVQDDDFRLEASALPVGAFSIAVVSASTADVLGFAGGEGRLCLGTPAATYRLPHQVQSADALGDATFAIGLAGIPWAGGPVAVFPGDTLFFQVFHRDWNPAPTSNLTNAVEVTFR